MSSTSVHNTDNTYVDTINLPVVADTVLQLNSSVTCTIDEVTSAVLIICSKYIFICHMLPLNNGIQWLAMYVAR